MGKPKELGKVKDYTTMERKAHNSLYEAALQVQSGITPEPEIPECVQQYFDNYFGDNLNEDTSDEDIIKAVEDLVDLCEAVCDAVGLKETANLNHPLARLGFYTKGSPNDPTVSRRPSSRVTSDKTGANPEGTTRIKHDTSYQPVIGGTGRGITKRIPDVDIPKKYRNSKTPIRTLKPSPEQLKKAIANQADNSPLLITKGRDSFEGKPYTKAIRPSDVRDAAKAKRIKRMENQVRRVTRMR